LIALVKCLQEVPGSVGKSKKEGQEDQKAMEINGKPEDLFFKGFIFFGALNDPFIYEAPVWLHLVVAAASRSRSRSSSISSKGAGAGLRICMMVLICFFS